MTSKKCSKDALKDTLERRERRICRCQLLLFLEVAAMIFLMMEQLVKKARGMGRRRVFFSLSPQQRGPVWSVGEVERQNVCL